MSTFVTLARFGNPVEANIAKGRLEQAGIPCFLSDEHLITITWLYSNAVGGIRLQVHASDEAEAREILSAEVPYGDLLAESEEVSAQEAKSVQEERIVCPNCGSENCSRELKTRRSLWLSWIFLGLPLPFFSRSKHCYRCGYDWK